jgi:hypothetical protein
MIIKFKFKINPKGELLDFDDVLETDYEHYDQVYELMETL